MCIPRCVMGSTCSWVHRKKFLSYQSTPTYMAAHPGRSNCGSTVLGKQVTAFRDTYLASYGQFSSACDDLTAPLLKTVVISLMHKQLSKLDCKSPDSSRLEHLQGHLPLTSTSSMRSDALEVGAIPSFHPFSPQLRWSWVEAAHHYLSLKKKNSCTC